ARTASRSSCSRSLSTAALPRWCRAGAASLSSRTANSRRPKGQHGKEQAMADDALLKDLQRRMDGALEALRKEFGGLRTGRASASLLEPGMVNAYGGMVPLNTLANINVPEPRMMT